MNWVWVTGARGFIGRHLALLLSQSGRKVGGVGHGGWALDDAQRWGISAWLNGEVDHQNLHELRKITGDPARVFHLAGGSSVAASIQSPYEDFQRTVGTTTRLKVSAFVRLKVPRPFSSRV